MTESEPGTKVEIHELSESPMESIDRTVALSDMAKPTSLGPTDVLVEITASGVNWVDLLMTSGQYQHVPEPPYTPGLEYAGRVAAIGSAVERWAVGQRVIADGLATGPRSLGEYRRWGGWASWALAPEDGLIATPERLDDAQAATVLGAYETAYHVLVHRGRVQPGESVLVLGASGTTGLAAVHVAKALGATVIATGRTAAKLELVREQGADHVLTTADDEGGVRRFRGEVKELTGGRGVDVVHDGVGGALSLESLRCTRFGARYLIVGWAATPDVARGKGKRGAPNANVFPTNLVMMKGLDVLGCPSAIATHLDPSLRKPRLERVLGWLEDGAITPFVGRRYPLAEVHQAMRDKWRSAHVGSLVLCP